MDKVKDVGLNMLRIVFMILGGLFLLWITIYYMRLYFEPFVWLYDIITHFFLGK